MGAGNGSGEGMRHQLTELNPMWLTAGEERGRMGFSFECPVCNGHRLEVWFDMPVDGGTPITETVGRQLYQRDGDDFDNLGIYPPLTHDGMLVFLYEGIVVVG